jgi:phosphoribosyl-ATP pyrophosphohydrolase
MPGSFINAKLHEESIETIPTHSRKTTSCAVFECADSIWRQETIHNASIESTFVK